MAIIRVLPESSDQFLHNFLTSLSRFRRSNDIFSDNSLNLNCLFDGPFTGSIPHGFSSPPGALPPGNGFHDDAENHNGMKTISSGINGHHAAPSSSSEEEEAEMEEEEEMAVASPTQLPPHLIPPLGAEQFVHNGIPLDAGGSIGNGKSGRSKCVWFRSSCYI